ncbi:MAG: glycosyltransferase family 2 protein [Desulfobulbaceae bacterium]|nr:glycosyltransferase family 2 protein [Desulfobulbaceae bacterium]
MSPRISVIIVNYNAGPELLRCVHSVAESPEDLEIIVIDNDSRDNSVQDLLASYRGAKKLKTMTNRENLGFAAACNQGSLIAGGDFFLYLNPDCVVEPQTLSILAQYLENDPQAGMAGGLILNQDGSEQRGCRRSIPTPWKSLVNTFGLQRLAGLNQKVFSDFRLDREPLPDKPVEVDAISGACMMVNRKAFEDVGPMDEGYFLHCEDLDWCMRFRQKGWKIMFVPQARLLHNKGLCSASRPVFVEWSKHRGMVRFYRKFFADQYPKPVQWFFRLGTWLRFGLSVAKIYLQKLFRPGNRCG